jgi:hypothetical protein
MWLPLLAGSAPPSIAALAASMIARHPFAAARSVLSGRSLSFAFLREWRLNLEAWIQPFREAALRHHVYVCPGSTFLPGVDRNETRDWELTDRRIYNTACILGPTGRILALTRKVYLTAEERLLGISPGSAADLLPCRTELGELAILICLDGFYESLVSRLDSAGARLLIQPSANPVPWEAVLSGGRWYSGARAAGCEGLHQREQWLTQGIGSLIQGRENVGASINPMSVSRILGHLDEGQSSAFRNLGRVAERCPAPAAIASSWDREEIVQIAL